MLEMLIMRGFKFTNISNPPYCKQDNLKIVFIIADKVYICPMKLICSRCNGSKVIKAGIVSDKQRFKCKDCGYHFTLHQRSRPDEIRRAALYLYLEGVPLRQIGKLLGVHNSAVSKWLRPILPFLQTWRKKNREIFHKSALLRELYENEEDIIFMSLFRKLPGNKEAYSNRVFFGE